MSEEVAVQEREETQAAEETPATEEVVQDLGPVKAAIEELDPKVQEGVLKALSYAFDVPVSDIETMINELTEVGVVGELRTVVGHILRSVADEYEATKNTRELERTRMVDLKEEWSRTLALAAEGVSTANAHREKNIRNVLAILNNAMEGRTEEQNALQLEVYNFDPQQLAENEDAWATFESMLETRQLNSLQPDVGYNIVVLPHEIGDPAKSDRASVENTASFVRKLASLGEKLNIVFFLDVRAAGKDKLEENPVEAAKGNELHEDLEDTLSFLSWDPKDRGRLGSKLAALFGSNDVSRYIVLNGGMGLLASRKLDEDLTEQDVQHGVLLSPSAVSAGLTAWSVAGDGPPVIPSGQSPGTGGIVGVEAAASVALRKHQELARRAGVNSVFIPSLSAMGAVDTSVTMARADPAFNDNVGQCSVEAILLSQYINRMGAQLIRKLSKNEVNSREQEIVKPMQKELAELKKAGVLRDYDVIDNDIHDTLAAESNAIDITISFQEVGKLDRASITVSRKTAGED